jgi:hypothetical protein
MMIEKSADELTVAQRARRGHESGTSSLKPQRIPYCCCQTAISSSPRAASGALEPKVCKTMLAAASEQNHRIKEGNSKMGLKKSSSSKSSKGRSRPSSRASKSGTPSQVGSRTTADHDEIREWAEERGGIPARVQGTGDPEEAGLIRIEFPDAPSARDENLEEISWDEFFEKLDEGELAIVLQDETSSGEQSNFHKIVKRARGRSAGSGR